MSFFKNKKQTEIKEEEEMFHPTHTDYSCLSRALQWAKERGYVMPPLEKAVFDGNSAEPLRASLRRWAQGLLFDHDFARAVFGEDDVDEYGQDLFAIELWATQHAVEFQNKLIAVNSQQRSVTLLKAPEVDHMMTEAITDAPTTISYPEKVVIDLTRAVSAVPFKTHHIEKVRVYGGIPSWQFHLKQMAIAENPFLYINDYIDQQIAQSEVTEPNVV